MDLWNKMWLNKYTRIQEPHSTNATKFPAQRQHVNNTAKLHMLYVHVPHGIVALHQKLLLSIPIYCL